MLVMDFLTIHCESQDFEPLNQEYPRRPKFLVINETEIKGTDLVCSQSEMLVALGHWVFPGA